MSKAIASLATLRVSRRVPIRIPGSMMNEVDRIVGEHPEFNYNRQQFVETAIREKIERSVMLESARSNANIVTVGHKIRSVYR